MRSVRRRTPWAVQDGQPAVANGIAGRALRCDRDIELSRHTRDHWTVNQGGFAGAVVTASRERERALSRRRRRPLPRMSCLHGRLAPLMKDNTPMAGPPPPSNPQHVWQRLVAMRTATGPRPAFLEEFRCALDLWPWWMLAVHSPDRAHASASHLGSLLCRKMAGFYPGGERHRRAFDVLSCTVPVGTPEQISSALRSIVLRPFESGGDPDDSVAALLGLAHLEFSRGIHQGRFLEVLSQLAADSDPVLLAALHLVGSHRLEGAVEWVAGVCRMTQNPVVVTAAAGVLPKLGHPGKAALGQMCVARPGSKAIVNAAVQALHSGDFDALDPLLSSKDSWEQRNAAIRMVGNLVEAGAPTEPAIEILLQRYRDDDDADNRAVISTALGKVLRRHGSPDAVGTLLEEKVTRGDELLDAILFSGIEVPEASIPALVQRRSRRGGVNRLLASRGLVPSLVDWVGHHVLITSMQWDGFVPSSPTVRFFEDPSTIRCPELAQAIHDHEFPSHNGSLGAAYLRLHPEDIPIIERLRVIRQNFGHQESWEVYSAMLAGAWNPVPTEAAELVCAFGSHVGPPPEATPRAIGRLLAVASSSLPNSREAMRILGVMGEQVRELSVECLSSLPAGIRSLSPEQSAPSDEGIGANGHADTGLGRPRCRLADPFLMEKGWPVIFGIIPTDWRLEPAKQVWALIMAAQCRTDWFKNLRNWSDAGEVTAFVKAVQPEDVCRLILAIRQGPNGAMRSLGSSLARALSPEDVPKEFRWLLGSSNNDSENESTSPSDNELRLEEILRGLK